MTLIDRLLTTAKAWSEATGRSDATLASQIARDGKFFERLRSGKGCTVTVADRFFAFFRDPASWPDDAVPAQVSAAIDGVDLGLHAAAVTATSEQSSSGKADGFSAQVAA